MVPVCPAGQGALGETSKRVHELATLAYGCAMRSPLIYLLTLVTLGTTAQPAVADDEAFAGCLSSLEQQALTAGVSEATVRDVMANVSRVERVIQLDRNQPEFTRTFADYYNRRVTDSRVRQGRELLARHADLLDDVRRNYGVPPHYLLAFWGLETNFGGYFGNIPTTNALATLACDERRASFFAGEFLAALRILDAGDIDRENMLGSWAGAMGHMQFLPSVFLQYAIDGDGDGRRNLWGSVPDAMASAGNFLNGLGWESGLRWGREIRLPANFDYSLAGRQKRRPLSEWVRLGVTDAYGGSLPPLDLEAAVLVPAGHEGPAFLVYRNFDVIMRWNRAEYYAIAVGRLADRIAGGVPLTRDPDTGGEPVTRDAVRQLQEDLATLGYDAGTPDGIFGPATRSALSEFQRSRDLIADGHLDSEAIATVTGAVSDSAGE